MDNPLFSHLNEQEEGDRDSVDGAFKAVCRFVKYTNAFRLRPEWKAEDERPMLMAAGAVSDPLIDEDEQTSSYTCHDEHLLMVASSWGEGPSRRLSGNLVMIDVAPQQLDGEPERKKLATYLSKLNHQILRWQASRAVLSFPSHEDLVNSFGKISTGHDYRQINSGIVCYEAESTYPGFVHISVPKTSHDAVSADVFQSVVSLYGGKMFIHVAESVGTNSAIPDTEAPPLLSRICINLRLNTKVNVEQTMKRHQSMAEKLAGKNWAKVERDTHQFTNTQLYRHKMAPSVSFGLHLTGMSDGVQYVLTVCSSKEKYVETVTFYRHLLQTKGYNSHEGQVENCILNLDRQSELVIRYHPEVQVRPACPSASLSFRPKSLQHMAEYIKGGATHSGWYSCTDPDGNTVNLCVPLV